MTDTQLFIVEAKNQNGGVVRGCHTAAGLLLPAEGECPFRPDNILNRDEMLQCLDNAAERKLKEVEVYRVEINEVLTREEIQQQRRANIIAKRGVTEDELKILLS